MNGKQNRRGDPGARRPRSGADTPAPAGPSEVRVMNCDDIQAVLFDYMTRELGQARGDLVRAHLRRCPACQAAAAEAQATLDVLRLASSAQDSIPRRLSEERRIRIVRALMHPVLDWIDMHHILVSIVVALIVLAALLGWLRRTHIWRNPPEPGVPVIIGDKLPWEATQEESP